MLKDGCKIRDIMKETGIKSHTVIYWHCDPEKRKAQEERGRKWRAEHPDEWREIAKRAEKKFRKKHGKNT